MEETKKFFQPKIYLSKRMTKFLFFIEKFPITLIEAPSASGKLSCIREYFRRSSIKSNHVFWMTFPDSSTGACWYDICLSLSQIDPAFQKKNSNFMPPFDADTTNQIINELSRMKVNEDYYFVIDNINFLNSLFREKNSIKILRSVNPKIHIIIIADYVSKEHKYDITATASHYISADDLTLTPAEITEFFSINGIKITDGQALKFFEIKNNQLFLLSMNAKYYFEHGKMPEYENLFELIQKTYWDSLSGDMRLILYAVHRFDWFVASQIRYIISSNPLLPTSSLDKYNLDFNCNLDETFVQGLLPKITSRTTLVKLDGKKRKYHMHDIIKSFISEKFDSLYDDIRFALLRQIGNWYATNGDVLNAIKCYYEVKDYKSICALNLNSFDINISEVNKNREFFIDLLRDYPLEDNRESIFTNIFISTFLFVLGETELLTIIFDSIKEFVSNSSLDAETLKEIKSMITFYSIFHQFNNIEKMRSSISKIHEFQEKLPAFVMPDFPWTVNTPSILYVYHTRIGYGEKELEAARQIQQSYICMTNQKESGAVSIMNCELLIQRGKFDEALVLIKRILSSSSRSGPIYVQVCANLCNARIALFKGDFKSYINSVKEITAYKHRVGNEDIKELCEFALGALGCISSDDDFIPEWLQHGEIRNAKTHSINLPYINMIYGNFLLRNKSYSKFLAVFDDIMYQAEMHNLIIPRIYFYLFAALCHYKLGDTEKAIVFLRNALDMSIPDMLYMPLAEKYMFVYPIIEKITNTKYKEFIINAKALSEKLTSGSNTIKSAVISQATEISIQQKMNEVLKEIKTKPQIYSGNSLGLTQNEYEIARLASMRISNKSIADELYITENSVKYAIKIIFKKLNIKSRFELKQFFS